MLLKSSWNLLSKRSRTLCTHTSTKIYSLHLHIHSISSLLRWLCKLSSSFSNFYKVCRSNTKMLASIYFVIIFGTILFNLLVPHNYIYIILIVYYIRFIFISNKFSSVIFIFYFFRLWQSKCSKDAHLQSLNYSLNVFLEILMLGKVFVG